MFHNMSALRHVEFAIGAAYPHACAFAIHMIFREGFCIYGNHNEICI